MTRRMTNDEIRMTKECLMTKFEDDIAARPSFPRASSLGLLSSFVLRHSSFLALLLCLVSASAAVPFRPAPGKGRDTKTLLLYTETRSAYSLVDSLEVLKLQLGRVATSL